MHDTLGLLAEAVQLATDLGHDVREEPLGDLPGGACRVGQSRWILVNLDLPAAERLAVIVAALREDDRVGAQPMSRALAARIAGHGSPGRRPGTGQP
ncbi:MAG: hypothetical protein EBR86_15130 [Planctomycetia bacterium]|nr:hypothetical protein [Planctomycetia bacterium]